MLQVSVSYYANQLRVLLGSTTETYLAFPLHLFFLLFDLLLCFDARRVSAYAMLNRNNHHAGSLPPIISSFAVREREIHSKLPIMVSSHFAFATHSLFFISSHQSILFYASFIISRDAAREESRAACWFTAQYNNSNYLLIYYL